MSTLQLDFYGCGVLVESAEDEFQRSVEHDFSYFLGPASRPVLHVAFDKSRPDYDGLPDLSCSFATPRNICFSDGRLMYIDYFGQALNVYDRQSNSCRIMTQDLELAHEIAYLTILSRISEALEGRHLHRVHGLGIESEGQGAIILLPSGGGKSTLALSLLRNENRVRLVSEDSPLLRPDGHMLPFPLRIGVHPANVPADIDPRFLRADKRIEFSSKTSIDIRCFENRIARGAVPVKYLLLGVRSTGRRAQIIPVSRYAVVRHILANSIIGIGLYQGLEYVLQKSLSESVRHMGLFFSRSYNNAVLLRYARVFQFTIGRDPDRNCECLRDFLSR
jgi:hypothetical protein